MGDAGGQLAERGELLCLHQPILLGAQVVQRLRELTGALLNLVKQPGILNGNQGLVGKGTNKVDLACRCKGCTDDRVGARQNARSGVPLAQQWYPKHGATC